MNSSAAGFTIIELMLYAGLAAVVVASISATHILYQQTLLKTMAIAEVEQQGAQLTHQISRAIRQADSIISPSPGADSTSLQLATYGAPANPTTFSFDSEQLYVCEGTGCTQTTLTNNQIQVTNASFKNISYPDTPGAIRVEITVAHANPGGRGDLSFEQTFVTTATLRHP